jgi:hypothetical protein
MKALFRIFPALLLGLLPFAAAAQDQTRVDPSSTERIDRHNVCRQVTNNTGAPIMVPHLTPNEWAVGGSAFLNNPYPSVIISPCPEGLWYWELLDVTVIRCQTSIGSGTCTTYFGTSGMPITTRFSQYNGSDSYGDPNTLPICDTDRAGERVVSNRITGTTSQTWFRSTYVCNRAAEIAPIILSDIRLEPGQSGVVGQVNVSGLPHTGTEAFITGLRYTTTDSTIITPRLYLNGAAHNPAHTGIPIGYITPNSPYLDAFNAAYGTSMYYGIGVPARNGQTVRIEVTAPSQTGTYPLFAKFGDKIALFNVIVAEPEILPLTSGGSISSNSSNHPVFSLFQSCFGIGPGAHLSFPGACTMNTAFWDQFYTEACKANPYSLSITMGGFSLASSGSACATTGFTEFQQRARISSCVPNSCAINADGGPSSCVFTCN